MKIKRLDIHGFKSFADKTIFHFPYGITAIVGPNGCGKSNVIDAIRWVLGEHNVRQLRGRHMEDIIFNGSAERGPLGMAEVVLTLSNEDGLAPARYLNFTEIEIVRRLYRSGESEYFINRVPCRLRDIVDIFTDTGVGTKAYSIVEQGSVDWFVNARAEERRPIFEEAAGINRYKHRKEAALRRLASTRENLVRVNDITGEVKRQLNSLNRQARKAKRYKEIRDELKGIELFLSSEEYAGLKAHIEDLQTRIGEVKRDLTGQSAEAAKREASLEGLRVRYLDEESRLKEIKKGILDLSTSIQRKERDLELSDIRMQELERIESRLIREIEEFQRERSSIYADTKRVSREIEVLSVFLDDCRGKLEETGKRVDLVSDKLNLKDGELNKKKMELLDTLTRAAELNNWFKGYQREEEILNNRLTRARNEREGVKGKTAESLACLHEISEEMDRLRLLEGELEEQDREDQAVLGLLEKELLRKDDSIRKMKDELASLSSRLATMNELRGDFRGFRDGVRAIMKVITGKDGDAGAREEGLSGIHGVVADLIEAKEGFEEAVESVMGEKLQCIVAGTEEDCLKAVRYLKSHSLGRGAFISLNSAGHKGGKAPEGADAEESGDYENGLMAYLDIRDGYFDILRRLLKDVMVVKSIDEALSLRYQGKADKIYVTREGEVIDSSGIIAGGSSKNRDGSILREKREVKKLSQSVQEMESKLKISEIERGDILKRIDKIKDAMETSRSKMHLNALAIVDIEARQRALEEEVQRLNGRLQVLDFELEEAETQLESLADRKVETEKERGSVVVLKRGLEESIGLLSEEVQVLANEKDGMMNHLTEQKVSIASTKEKLDALNSRLTSRKRASIDMDQKIQLREREKKDARKEADTIKADRLLLKKDIERLLADKERLQQDETEKEDALNSISSSIDRLESELKVIRADLVRLNEELMRFDLNSKEAELKLGHLSEKIDERYGISIDSYRPSQEMEVMDRGSLLGRCDELKAMVYEFGDVNLSAIHEYAALEERYQFLTAQQTDLMKSIDSLQKAIQKINHTTKERFKETFDAINLKFQEVFPRFFRGGKAELRILDERDLLNSGIEITVQTPGKRLQTINLLSGGEKALTAVSLLFSIFMIKPGPFYLLDEIDAPLDDVNTDRLDKLLADMARKSQFIMITHNKHTMKMADTLFGVTMESPGISKLVSVELN